MSIGFITTPLQALGLGDIPAQRMIGDIVATVTQEEEGYDELRITDNPVEQGATVTDHAFKLPARVVLRVGWSNSDSIFNSVDPSYLSGIYSDLLALQVSRVPFTIVTGKRTYQSMLFESLAQTTDEKTEYALMVTARCRQIVIVNTQTVAVPPNAVQANPQNNGAVVPTGRKSVTVSNVGPLGPLPAGMQDISQ